MEGKRLKCISDIVANILMTIIVAMFGFLIVTMFLNMMSKGSVSIEEQVAESIRSLEEQLNVMAGYISRDNHIILILSAGPNGAALKYVLVDGQPIEQAYINDELVNLTTTDYRIGSYETAVVKIPYTGDQASVIIVYGGGSVEVFVKKI